MVSENNEQGPIQTHQAAITDIATVDVRDASAEGVKLMEQRVENQKKMLAIAIRLTSPSQWTIFSGRDKTTGDLKETIYPTGGAADTILRRAFGLTWGPKRMTVGQDENGQVVAVCKSWLMQGERQVEEFEGRRYYGGFVRTEADLRKGAVENMKSCAVRDLLGLRFRSPEELREMGLDVGKLERRAEFQSHAEHGSGPEAPVVPFGKNKGKPITDLTPKQLDWYIEAAKANVADPTKSKWRAKEERWLKALQSELAGRGAPKNTAPATDYSKVGPPPIDDDGEPPIGDER